MCQFRNCFVSIKITYISPIILHIKNIKSNQLQLPYRFRQPFSFYRNPSNGKLFIPTSHVDRFRITINAFCKAISHMQFRKLDMTKAEFPRKGSAWTMRKYLHDKVYFHYVFCVFFFPRWVWRCGKFTEIVMMRYFFIAVKFNSFGPSENCR